MEFCNKCLVNPPLYRCEETGEQLCKKCLVELMLPWGSGGELPKHPSNDTFLMLRLVPNADTK
jgi:hypothetical protein